MLQISIRCAVVLAIFVLPPSAGCRPGKAMIVTEHMLTLGQSIIHSDLASQSSERAPSFDLGVGQSHPLFAGREVLAGHR